MQVKFFRVDNVQPGALQQLEQQVNDFLSSLVPATSSTSGGGSGNNPPVSIDIQYQNDHQSNLFAMVYYDGLTAASSS